MATRFIWYDLLTTDAPAAAAFYKNVLGFTTVDASSPGGDYSLFQPTDHAGLSTGGPVAGLMGLQSAHLARGLRPVWLGHLGVQDIDASVTKLRELGGSIRRGPDAIPGIGRFAVAADPQGAVFHLFEPNREAPVDPPVHSVGWHELLTDDPLAALDFYAAFADWLLMEEHNMGPIGIYRTFAPKDSITSADASPIDTSGAMPAIGGIMARPPEVPAPFWLYYFHVPALGAALERVSGGGGMVHRGAQPVPGGGWIAQCSDPQGAIFALLSATR